jgi:hypothetical protein
MRSSHARRLTALAFCAGLVAALSAAPAQAASSAGCDGGAFTVAAPGQTVTGSPTSTTDTTIPAAALTGGMIQIRGKFQEWDVDPATLSVRTFVFTGVPNKLDMTGGRRTVAFESKLADLRGATLTGDLSVSLDKDAIQLSRSGSAASMKIQGKDCANGGIFQMEPSRADGTATTFTHTLGAGAFYFDNPNFRARIGEVLNGTTVAARINFANDTSSRFVGRDSPQEATRLSQFGRVSTWSVKSGGRMGQVMGEDAVEVAPPATACTHQCQAQNRTRGAAAVLGFPFPVPTASRITPAFPPA